MRTVPIEIGRGGALDGAFSVATARPWPFAVALAAVGGPGVAEPTFESLACAPGAVSTSVMFNTWFDAMITLAYKAWASTLLICNFAGREWKSTPDTCTSSHLRKSF